MSNPSLENALDHVVVVMFENRSFDNLLGRLYEPGEVASFEGVIGKELSKPGPGVGGAPAADGIVPYGVAANMNTPNPDSGEEYPHINTQLFGISIEENRFKLRRRSAFNGRATGQAPTMDGFVADYISVVDRRAGAPADVDEYAPDHDRLHARADAGALGDRARASRRSITGSARCRRSTYPNRSFFHAGASSGYVVNVAAGIVPAYTTTPRRCSTGSTRPA